MIIRLVQNMGRCSLMPRFGMACC